MDMITMQSVFSLTYVGVEKICEHFFFTNLTLKIENVPLPPCTQVSFHINNSCHDFNVQLRFSFMIIVHGHGNIMLPSLVHENHVQWRLHEDHL